MHYLIDGHNLIASMPDISLDDPNDEMKLVLRLKGWASASPKRRVTVIFDGGLPGGPSVHFSNSDVKVVFASTGNTADALLIHRIRKVRNPPEYTVVSSDQEIIAAAKTRRMPFLRSNEFVAELAPEQFVPTSSSAKQTSLAKDEDPRISDEELDEWLQLFGPAEPARSPKLPPKREVAPGNHPDPERKPPARRPLKTDKTAGEKLDESEVDEWLRLFQNRDDSAPK